MDKGSYRFSSIARLTAGAAHMDARASFKHALLESTGASREASPKKPLLQARGEAMRSSVPLFASTRLPSSSLPQRGLPQRGANTAGRSGSKRGMRDSSEQGETQGSAPKRGRPKKDVKQEVMESEPKEGGEGTRGRGLCTYSFRHARCPLPFEPASPDAPEKKKRPGPKPRSGVAAPGETLPFWQQESGSWIPVERVPHALSCPTFSHRGIHCVRVSGLPVGRWVYLCQCGLVASRGGMEAHMSGACGFTGRQRQPTVPVSVRDREEMMKSAVNRTRAHHLYNYNFADGSITQVAGRERGCDGRYKSAEREAAAACDAPQEERSQGAERSPSGVLLGSPKGGAVGPAGQEVDGGHRKHVHRAKDEDGDPGAQIGGGKDESGQTAAAPLDQPGCGRDRGGLGEQPECSRRQSGSLSAPPSPSPSPSPFVSPGLPPGPSLGGGGQGAAYGAPPAVTPLSRANPPEESEGLTESEPVDLDGCLSQFLPMLRQHVAERERAFRELEAARVSVLAEVRAGSEELGELEEQMAALAARKRVLQHGVGERVDRGKVLHVQVENARQAWEVASADLRSAAEEFKSVISRHLPNIHALTGSPPSEGQGAVLNPGDGRGLGQTSNTFTYTLEGGK